MQMNVVRTVTVRGQSEGLEKVESDLNRVSAAQEKVGQTGEATARVTESSAKRQISAAGAYQRVMERNDRLIALQTRLARETAVVNRAFDQGAIDAGEQGRAIEMLTAKYQRLIAAEERARASAQSLAAANDNQAASMMRVAAANDNAMGSTANIAAQFQDIGVTAAMGMHPIMIALQQGTQLSAVLNTMQNPLRGLAMAFVSIINPVSLLTIGFVALTAAAVQFFTSSGDDAKKAETALEAHDKWLDEILVGYKNVREAARLAGEEALRLPQAEVQLSLDADAAARQAEYADALAKVQVQILATNTNQQTLTTLWMEGGDAALVQRDALLAIQDAAMAANPNLDQLALSLKSFIQENPDSVLRSIADAMLENVLAARNAEVAYRKVSAAAQELRGNSDPRQFMPGVADAIEDITRKTVDLRTEQERLDEQFRNAAAGARTISELNALVAAYDNMQRAAQAAAWAVKNSGDAAVVAAGQYGTATGAANAYANALWALGNMIPQVAAAQAAMAQMQQAEEKHALATSAAGDLLRMGAINRSEYNERISETTQRLEQAKDAISGVTALEEQLARQTVHNSIEALSGREQALARVKLQYADQAKAIEEARSHGAAQADIDRLLAQNNEQLAAALANTNSQFDQTAAKSGGAAKAMKAAEKDFNSFISTADKLAEKLFPGEYARREAEQLAAALDKYGASLDAFQRQAVEAEIGNLSKAAELNLRNLEDKTKDTARNMAKELQSTLGSILGDLFSKPIEDFDDFIDRVFSGLGQLGQANLSASMDMLFGGGEGLSKAVEKGAKAGTEAGASGGIFDGLANLFGGAGGGASGNPMMNALGSAAGGLGIGYQTQDPMMGALGGALSGIGGGPIGIVAGALGGFIGGLFGASKALKEAQEKLAKLRGEIDSFLDVGEGRGVGEMTKAFREYWDKSHEYQELAMKAGDGALQKRLQSAVNTFFLQLDKDFRLGFEGTLEALSSGQGMGGAFVSAQQSIVGLREELKAFIADTEFMGNKLGELASIDNAAEVADNLARARRAAQDYALSVLSGALEMTEMEKAVAEAEGRASALQVTLEQLGMAADEAAGAINDHLGLALAKLRDELTADLNASINDLSGFGFLNEIAEAQAKYQERLRDGAALGLDGSLALRELNLSLADIVQSAGLSQAQIDMLAEAFPLMAGLIETVAGQEAMRAVADAEAALRSAYEAQRREIEQTISRLERFGQSIRKFRDDMRLSDASPMGQEAQLAEAAKQFRDLATRAATGDQEAMDRLTGVSQSYLDEAREYYASSEAYAQIWREVDQTLADIETKSGRQLSEAQRQLDLLDRQIGALITINSSVLSVTAAISALAMATASRDAALQQQIGSMAQSSNAIGAAYQTYLGRPVEAAGLAYWQGQQASGWSVDQIVNWIKNSPEALARNGIPQYADGGVHMGGLRIVGERGPELEATGPARYWNAQQTAALMGARNDNGDVVAELRALRSELATVKGELARVSSTVALDGQETRRVISQGNASTEELASSIKRVVAA